MILYDFKFRGRFYQNEAGEKLWPHVLRELEEMEFALVFWLGDDAFQEGYGERTAA